MIIVNKQIPELDIDRNVYKPFIKNEWFRRNYMWFAYGLMILIFEAAFFLGRFGVGSLLTKILLYVAVYLVHESLHILTVCKKGDIYLSHSGMYLWLTPNFVLSKKRYLLFMTLPLLLLTGVTGTLSFFVSGEASLYLKLIAWLNAIAAGSDIINTVLILIKPRNAFFYRGFYRRKN